MTVLAISKDSPDDSRDFAASYRLPFLLLSDPDGTVSRLYSGVTSDDNTLPGTTIIRADGTIAFRRLASAKDDRMTSAELFAALDATLGTTGPTSTAAHYAAIDRLQLRVDLGGGITDDRATGVAALTGLVPLGHHVILGPRVSYDLRDSVTLGGTLVLRLPITANAGALELGGLAGWSPEAGAIVGGSAGVWFAMSPTWSLQLTGVVTNAPSYTLSLGVGRLFEW